jgi:predicted Zn-dependent peptidase
VFDRDSITNIAHQLGYFETVATADVFTGVGSPIAAVTLEQVADAARELFRASNRTIGWFDPLPVGKSENLKSEI